MEPPADEGRTAHGELEPEADEPAPDADRLEPGADERATPPSADRGLRRSPWSTLLLGLLLVSLVALVVVSLIVRPNGAPEPPGGTIPPASPPTPSPAESPGPPEVAAAFPSPVGLAGLSFRITEPTDPSPDCLTHTIGARPAFLSGCPSQPEVYLFHAEVRNESAGQLPFRLSNFVLVARDGSVHTPVELAEPVLAQRSLPRFTLLDPGATLTGWLVFGARPGFVPERLSYPFREGIVVILFPGEHRIGPPM